MTSDAFSPRTTSRQIDTPNGYRIYTTTRDVAAEFPIPAEGSALTVDNFIGGFPGHYIMQVDDRPKGNGKTVTVTHGALPSGDFVEWESEAHTFPAIYPGNGTSFFPGGSRQRQRVVPAEVTYNYALNPDAWISADGAVWDYSNPSTGPLDIKSYMLEAASVNFIDGDGDSGQVGDFLNSAFITQDVLNNTITINAPGSLSYIIAASVPSATTYAEWVAAKTKFITSRTIHRWYCFYLKRTVRVFAQ